MLPSQVYKNAVDSLDKVDPDRWGFRTATVKYRARKFISSQIEKAIPEVYDPNDQVFLKRVLDTIPFDNEVYQSLFEFDEDDEMSQGYFLAEYTQREIEYAVDRWYKKAMIQKGRDPNVNYEETGLPVSKTVDDSDDSDESDSDPKTVEESDSDSDNLPKLFYLLRQLNEKNADNED